MKHVIGENTRIELVYGYTCDSCQREIVAPFELQESLIWSNRGGYGSVFGDGTEMTLDLCQDCIKAHLGKFIQFHNALGEPANLDTAEVPLQHPAVT